MKLIKRLLALAGCCSAFFFWGCKSQVLDGPGMVYEPQWKEFTVSRSDSYAQYNFWFTVSDDDETSLLTGECRDEEGNLYLEEEGIELPSETLWALRRLNLEKLTTALPQEQTQQSDEFVEILDASTISLFIVLPDGQTVEKCVTEDMTIEIYELLLPCFNKK